MTEDQSGITITRKLKQYIYSKKGFDETYDQVLRRLLGFKEDQVLSDYHKDPSLAD